MFPPEWIVDIYKHILKRSQRVENLYVSIKRIQKLDGGYTEIRVRPVLMGKEYGRHLKYSPFVRDIKTKDTLVLRLDDFLDLVINSKEADEFQIPFDRFRKRDISVGV